jgi:hypothetical protein
MIFLAVASPTPGRVSRSFALALFKSTFAVDALDWLPEAEPASVCIQNAIAAIAMSTANNL